MGLVCMAHGWEYNYYGIEIKIATAHMGNCVNDITAETLVDPLCGNTVVNGVSVMIKTTSKDKSYENSQTIRRTNGLFHTG